MSTHINCSEITKSIAYSGTTGNFMPSGSKVINIKKATIPIEVKLPAGQIIKSTETGQLPNKELPMESITVHVFPDLKHVLVSIGIFCDNGCLIFLMKKKSELQTKRRRKLL